MLSCDAHGGILRTNTEILDTLLQKKFSTKQHWTKWVSGMPGSVNSQWPVRSAELGCRDCTQIAQLQSTHWNSPDKHCTLDAPQHTSVRSAESTQDIHYKMVKGDRGPISKQLVNTTSDRPWERQSYGNISRRIKHQQTHRPYWQTRDVDTVYTCLLLLHAAAVVAELDFPPVFQRLHFSTTSTYHPRNWVFEPRPTVVQGVRQLRSDLRLQGRRLLDTTRCCRLALRCSQGDWKLKTNKNTQNGFLKTRENRRRKILKLQPWSE